MGSCRKVPLLLLISFHSWPAEEPESGTRGAPGEASDLRVTVNVYNGTTLPPGDLRRAEDEAEKIFRYAGIQLTWITGLLAGDVNDNTPSEKSNPNSLQLRIWTRAMAGRRPPSSEILGFCLSMENGDAVVLADAIQKRAAIGATEFAPLLGLAMAHELGHLLLRSARHSVTGIMRARWTEKGLREDDRGYLRFTRGEAEFMRNEAKRRMGPKSACSLRGTLAKRVGERSRLESRVIASGQETGSETAAQSRLGRP